MRFCHVCSSELTPEATTCPICGTPVANQPPQAQDTVQQPQMPVQQTANTQPPKKEKKKKKNLGLKITAAVLAFIILAISGLLIADYAMYKNEIEAVEYITDFPVLKVETDFVVFDEKTFPSTNYSIKVERILYGGILKSDMFKQTKIIIDDTSTEPVYHIDFEEDGEYLITLEDIKEKEPETTVDFSTGTDTDFSTGTDTDFSTATDTDNEDEDDDDTPSKVVIKVTVDDGNKEAIGSVNLDSKPGDKPVEIPSDDETVSENFIKATDADFVKFQEFASGMYWLSFQGMEDIEYNSKTSSAQFVVDNLIFDPFKKGYSAFYTVDEDIVWQAGDPLLKFNGAYCIPEEYVKWICENIYNVKYENLAEEEFTASKTDYMWHYLYDGNYYHNDAPIGEPLDWEVTVTDDKLVNNRYEFTVESRAYSFEEGMVFSCNKTVTAAIKEIDGERYWSIYSIKNTDKTESDGNETDKPENTDRPTSVDAYTRDAEIYTAYLTGGELDNMTEYMDKSYVEIESCMADVNNDGTYELVISVRNTEFMGVRGYETNYACYTINNGSVIKLQEAYYGGGSMGGESLVIKYDSFLNQYLIMKTSLIRDGAWANNYECFAYNLVDGQVDTYIHTNSGFVSTNNNTYGSIAEEIKSETSLYDEDENGVYYWSANDSYITKEEYEQTQARFTEPTDSAYQMKAGTFSNPLGL